MSPSPHLAKILDLATAFEQQGDSQAAGILRARVRLHRRRTFFVSMRQALGSFFTKGLS